MLASPSDFATAHSLAYQTVGRVLGRVTGSRAIEAVADGFVVAVEVEGYAEPFEVAAGYEKRRGWVAELRDGTGRVWAVGAGARLPEAVASMGRAGNPPGPDERLRRLERAVRADPLDEQARHALLAARARLGDPMAGARLAATENLGPDADQAAVDAETARIVKTMTAAAWRRVPLRHRAKIAQLVIDREFRRAGLNETDHSSIWPHALVQYGKIHIVDGAGYASDWDVSKTPASWEGEARQWATDWASQISQEARDQARWDAADAADVAEADRQWREAQDDLYPNPAPHWSSRGPTSRKIYARGTIPRTTKTSPHLKKLYRALLKHYTARVVETKKGRTWDEVAAILKIRPKGRPSVALWGKALAERVFYAKIRGLAFSKDMISKLPKAER